MTGIRQLSQRTFGTSHPGHHTLSVDANKMIIRSVITTIEPDRAGDVIVPMGLRNQDDFMLNPVVLWAHNRTQFPPIGRCEWIDVQPKRIVAETRFAQSVKFAEDVFRLYQQGILRGWSIGFAPRKAYRVPIPAIGRGGRTVYPAPDAVGLRVEEWDLLEYSAVPIPENAGALTIAIQKGLVKDPMFRDWLRGSMQPHDVLEPLMARNDVLCSE
jgi:hypothetical protein